MNTLTIDPVRGRWKDTWNDLVKPIPNERILKRVRWNYAQPGRFYHTIDHVLDCFERLDEYPDEPYDRGAVDLAIWYHDIVYDPRSTRNEMDSVTLMYSELRDVLGVGSKTLQAAESLIWATVSHSISPSGNDPDEELFLDIDLSILGAWAGKYVEYEDNIRREYAFVPEKEFREARREILQGLLDRPVIFRTPYFNRRLEERARRNLQIAIDSLLAWSQG